MSSQPFLEDCSHPSTNEAGSYLASESDELSPPQASVFKGGRVTGSALTSFSLILPAASASCGVLKLGLQQGNLPTAGPEGWKASYLWMAATSCGGRVPVRLELSPGVSEILCWLPVQCWRIHSPCLSPLPSLKDQPGTATCHPGDAGAPCPGDKGRPGLLDPDSGI